MQTRNVNLPIVITGRHQSVTEAMREYALRKVEGLHLDYPKIIEAKVVLDVETSHGHRHISEIILFCANHIHIEAKSVAHDMYASIDETISRIARRMRKYKTRLLKNHRPREGSIKQLSEKVYSEQISKLGQADHVEHETQPVVILHNDNFNIRPLFPDDAIMDLELSNRPFVLFMNQDTHKLNIVYRRKDGEYGSVEIPS